ncbi:MAG TPA: Spy/CpxP family protein refolding chaperone [Burkholderiaceae bacterium]
MKPLFKASLFALSTLVLAGTAGAQSAPVAPVAPAAAAAPAAPHMHRGQRGEHMQRMRMKPEQRQARMAERRTRLHDALKLSPAQEPAWNAFVAQAMTPGQHKAGDFKARRAEMAALPLPQRMERRVEMMKVRHQRATSRLIALKSFYAALHPEQQKVLEAAMQRRGGKHGMRGGHGRGHRMQ